jgi:hypothetical protein
MDTTIRKKVAVEGYKTVEGEFVQNEEGWFCREADGIRWNYRDWGTPAPMDSPEEAALYLLSLNVADEDS